MTLIAVACYGDHAEIVTDSIQYSRNASVLGHSTKTLAIHHLDSAVVTQGSVEFGIHAKTYLAVAGADCASLDELTDAAPEILRTLWDALQPTEPMATVLIVGWSPRAQAFRTTCFAAEDNFAPRPAGDMFLIPTPWIYRPSDLEWDRVRTSWAEEDDFEKRVGHDPSMLLAKWRSMPALTPPQGAEGWIDLAEVVRLHRALDGLEKVLVAGNLFHTRLGRGCVTTRVVHQFKDQGEEFLKLVQGTSHPIAQALACGCGSGRPYGDCCLMKYHADKPCSCLSGKRFEDCCKVTFAASAEADSSISRAIA
ncbi:hypothetical protein [Nocardioides sp. AE5]|uniref:hypothetical protein n=1 Tax=Nocardioides sp. AE5 TaxID=2962573 RepID=UPI002881699D|nr:hypothetical protein [Nocardioides sp. AE5]MDT0201353.1 hypothetical protein [Nocardioides sp. AE5]